MSKLGALQIANGVGNKHEKAKPKSKPAKKVEAKPSEKAMPSKGGIPSHLQPKALLARLGIPSVHDVDSPNSGRSGSDMARPDDQHEDQQPLSKPIPFRKKDTSKPYSSK